MTAQCEVTAKRVTGSEMGIFERYLTVWVGLCIVTGIILGNYFPEQFQMIGKMEFSHVNIPVAILIWLMIIPMLIKVDFTSLHHVREHWKRYRCNAFYQLGGETIFHGLAWLGFHS